MYAHLLVQIKPVAATQIHIEPLQLSRLHRIVLKVLI